MLPFPVIAHPPLGARGAERGAGPRGCFNSSPTLSSVTLSQVPSQPAMSSFRLQPPPKRLEKRNTFYCTVVLSTGAHTTHLTQKSSSREAPIIYTERQYTYVLRGKAALVRTNLSPAVSHCANTERSGGLNHCACLLSPVITQYLHSIVQIPYKEEWTHLQLGDMRACSRSTASSRHRSNACIAKCSFMTEKGAPPAWRRARATLMT